MAQYDQKNYGLLRDVFNFYGYQYTINQTLKLYLTG